MRVHVIGRDHQATGIDAGGMARRFPAWLTDDANAVLTDVIVTGLWLPADSAWDAVLLRAEVIGVCRLALGNAGGQGAR